MKIYSKLLAVLCLTLVACLVVPVLLPVNLSALTSAQAASGVKLNKTKATIYNGKTLRLKVSGTSKSVTWSSSKTSVASVDKKGVVTAKKVGKATITAKVGGKKLTCEVKVKSPLSADVTDITLKAGKTAKVNLTWQLSGTVSMKDYDSSVVKCEFGKTWKNKKNTLTIKGLNPGTVTLQLKNSKTKDVVRIKVTVKASGSSGDSGSLVDKSSVSMGVGKSVTVHLNRPADGLPAPQWDGGMVDCKFGSWDGKGWPLTITGLAKGTTTVSILLYGTDKVLDKIKVTVK